MVKRNVLIVDDEPTQCKILSRVIENLGYNCLTMNGGIEVIDFFVSKKVIKGLSHRDIDVMLLDLTMPDIGGLEVLKRISSFRDDLQIIVLTSNEDVTSAVTAINSGAIDYIIKGGRDMFARVTASIKNAVEKRSLKYQVSHLARKGKDQVAFSDVIGQGEAISNSIKLAKKAVNSTIPILLEGPSGSGKELLARAIHGSGPRSGKPFIVVECDLLKSDDAEEDIFGSEKLLTDGVVKNIGKLREANNGTIFFGKIDALHPDLQVKLLRFMQEGEFTPVLGKFPIRVNVRVISSTCRDLKRMILAKKFREDLHYRIASFPIAVPSLNMRGEEDIKLLAENFCRDFSINENKKIKVINPDTFSLLYSYDWEDNVRQLKNSVFRAVVLCDGDFLKPEHFPQMLSKENSNITRVRAAIKKNSDVNSELVDVFDNDGRCKTLEILEEEIIGRLMDIYSGNLSEVAKKLDVGRSTVYRRLKIVSEVEDEKS